MAELDWDASPLGPRALWTPLLRTLTDLMLASAQPTIIAWGEDRLFFYNDAYLPILGQKHPAAFGRPFFEIWPEIKAEIQPLFDRVFDGVALQMDDIGLMLDRGSGPQKAHFSFSYCPLFFLSCSCFNLKQQ